MNKTKYIFITGGVVSGLGKGITAASLGRLLKSRGLKVTAQKLDPYLNVDPGTMNPVQHGEVFVTDDGAETDLDLGHYERFIDESLSQIPTSHQAEYIGKLFQMKEKVFTAGKQFKLFRMLQMKLSDISTEMQTPAQMFAWLKSAVQWVILNHSRFLKQFANLQLKQAGKIAFSSM